MEGLEIVLSVLGVSGVGGVFMAVGRINFYLKALKQARDTFDQWKTANKTIYAKVQADPEKQELAQVLSGGVKKIEALTGLDL